MLIQFNTFQKHSADSKLSTNTYLMSVAAVCPKSYKLKWMWFKHSSQFDIVYIWISKFNAIIATIYQLLLQYKHSYIRWLSNCGIYIRCAATFTYTSQAADTSHKSADNITRPQAQVHSLYGLQCLPNTKSQRLRDVVSGL